MNARRGNGRSCSALPSALLVALALGGCGGGGSGAGGAVPGDTTPPASPGAPSLAPTHVSVQVSWTAVPDAATYEVVRAGTRVAGVASSPWSDSGLTPLTGYCYQVAAIDAAGNRSAPGPESCTSTLETPPAFAGFNLPLSQATFWDVQWSTDTTSTAQGAGTTRVVDRGEFIVILGAPHTIAGVTAYPVEIHGDAAHEDAPSTSGSFAPRWKWLASAHDRLLGSVDGTTLQTVFDARTGAWPGGGLFAIWPSSSLSVATSSIYNGSPAVEASRSANRSRCESFPDLGLTVCGDSGFSFVEKELYAAGVGPVAYSYDNTYSSCGGSFCSGANWKYRLDVPVSSLGGDVLVREAEPNDSAAQATPAGNVKDSLHIIGTARPTDAGLAVDLGAALGTATIHDVYAVTVPPAPGGGSSYVTIQLNMPSGSDLDLLVFDATLTILVGYSAAYNKSETGWHEKWAGTLAPGAYLVAVRAATGGGAYVIHTF